MNWKRVKTFWFRLVCQEIEVDLFVSSFKDLSSLKMFGQFFYFLKPFILLEREIGF